MVACRVTTPWLSVRRKSTRAWRRSTSTLVPCSRRRTRCGKRPSSTSRCASFTNPLACGTRPRWPWGYIGGRSCSWGCGSDHLRLAHVEPEMEPRRGRAVPFACLEAYGAKWCQSYMRYAAVYYMRAEAGAIGVHRVQRFGYIYMAIRLGST